MARGGNDPPPMTAPTPIRHSVCRWPYAGIPLEDFCAAVSEMGISSVELLMPDELPVARKYGLECAMVSFPTGETPDGTVVGGIEKAFNRRGHQDTLVAI
jgi:hydroxypyruvate isomerase